MYKSKLVNLLEILTLQQLKDLKEFVKMPSNRLLKRDIEIFDALFQLTRKNVSFTDEDEVWNRILTKKEQTNKKKIRNRLLGALQRYISLEQLEHNNNLNNLMLAQYYLANSLDGNAQKALNKGLKDLKKDDSFDTKSEFIRFSMYEMRIVRDKDQRTVDGRIGLMENALKNFYELNRVRLICEKANRYLIVNSWTDLEKLNFEIESISKNSYSVHTLAYCNIYNLITKQEDIYQARLEEYLKVHESSLNKKYVKEFYEHLMNFCIRRINARDFSFAEKYLGYVETLEELGELLNQGVMEISRLRNIVISCLILDRAKQAKYFIDTYSQWLISSNKMERGAFIDLNMALINLHIGDLEKCHERIVSFQTSKMYRKDVYYRITCESLLLKVLFEKGDHLYFLKKADNFKSFIQRIDKLAAEKKRPFLNFLNALSLLVKGKKVDLKAIEREVLIMDFLWLKSIIKRSGQR